MSALRVLGSVGEPIHPEAWVWYWQHIRGGRCPAGGRRWQTGRGALLAWAFPGATTLKPGLGDRAPPRDGADRAEDAVVGAKEETTGQAIIAFVSLRTGSEPSEIHGQELRRHVAQKIGPIARPKTIIFTDDLPKTRSGKIMRRLLRDVAEGRDLGDTTTLADASVVDEIRRRAEASPQED